MTLVKLGVPLACPNDKGNLAQLCILRDIRQYSVKSTTVRLCVSRILKKNDRKSVEMLSKLLV
jgi:hypothetical protein